MSDRDMTAAMLAEIAKFQQRTGHLFRVELDDETVLGTDLYIPVTWSGDTYPARGHFIGYEGLEENVEPRINVGTVYVSGIDQEWISRVLAESLEGRRIAIWRVNFDASWALILNPVPVADGLMDAAHLRIDPNSGKLNIAIDIVNHLRNFDQPNGWHSNDEEHRQRFPNDGIYKYTHEASRQLRWRASN